MATTPFWDPSLQNDWLTLRWTADEIVLIQKRLLPLNNPTPDDMDAIASAFDQYKISGQHRLKTVEGALTINVLEFATVVFLIMLFAPRLRNSVLSLGSDNTATLCWLVRNRSSSGAADCLLKFLALICTIYHIRLVVHHVKGVDNHLSDWISRALGLSHADPHADLAPADLSSPTNLLRSIQQGLASAHPPDRRVVCRLLLLSALTTPLAFTTEDLLRLIMLLRRVPEIPSPLEPKIGFIINAYQRLSNRGVSLPAIPENFHAAYDLSKEWNNIPFPDSPASGV